MLLCTLSKNKMKKVVIILLVCCLFSEILFSYTGNQSVYGKTVEYQMTESKKHVKMKVLSVNKKQVKLKIINKGDKDYYFYERFVLKKREKNKWKKIEFKENVGFRMSMVAWKKSNTIIRVKWKKFFGKNLSKGRYKIKYARFNKTFRIK